MKANQITTIGVSIIALGVIVVGKAIAASSGSSKRFIVNQEI